MDTRLSIVASGTKQRLRVSLVLALYFAICFHGSFPASAFMTFKWFGGAIHRGIIQDALAPLGVSQASLRVIAKGADSQDIPLSHKYTSCPQNHCDDDTIQQGHKYWQERIKQAVADAKNADTNGRKRNKVLFEFGEGMHPVQDFYSHSNYLEFLLQNHKALEPVDWDNMPAAIRTGYYYYGGPFVEEALVSRARSVSGLQKKHAHLNLHAAADFEARKDSNDYAKALEYVLQPGDLLHKELNKDSARTLEGRIIAPEYGKTLHELARKLATEDTARQWENFKKMIVETYGDRAPEIISALAGTAGGSK
jgi:hypothetical protein